MLDTSGCRVLKHTPSSLPCRHPADEHRGNDHAMRISPIRKNTAANFMGQLVSKGLKIVLVPLQINLLGDQAFGLVGFYALILALSAFLDLGLSLTANREVARLKGAADNWVQAVRNLVRTFEIPYWAMGGLIGVFVLSFSDWFSDNWVTAPDLSRESIVFSVSIIGLMVAIRWPIALYRGVLLGLQHQVQANVLSIFLEIMAGVGSVLVILICPFVEALFVWLLIAGVMEIGGHVWYCWRILSDPSLPRARFRLYELKRVWRFAFGVNMAALIGGVLGRTDGLVLSRLLPINYLGYYSIAQRIPPLVGVFTTSLIVATTPSFVSHYEEREVSQMSLLYCRQTRWLSFCATGLAGALAAFSYPILLLWTQSESIAGIAALPFAIVSAATALDVMIGSVNQLSLSCGFTGPAVAVSAVTGTVVAAGTLMFAPSLGIAGAAVAWGASRMIAFVLYPFLVHKRVLLGYAKAWFLYDTLPFFIVGGLCYGCGGLLYHLFAAPIHGMLWIPIMLSACLLYSIAVLMLDLIPDWRQLVRLKPRAI